MNIELLKQEIIQEIKMTINNKQEELKNIEPENVKYKTILSELEILTLEIENVKKINQNNYDKKISEFEKLKSKYSFLLDLSAEKINYLLKIIKEHKKRIDDDYFDNIIFNDLIIDYKNSLMINGINPHKSITVEEITNIIKIIKNKKMEFDFIKEYFEKIIESFDPISYKLLKEELNNNIKIDEYRLMRFKNLGQDTLIERVLERCKQKNIQIENDKYIDSLLKSIVIGIEQFIKDNYKMYKQKLSLTIDENNIDDISELVDQIRNQLNQKNECINKILQQYLRKLELVMSMEKKLNILLSMIDINKDQLKIEKNIDLFNIDRDNIYEVFAQINLLNRINTKVYQQEDNNPKLS